MRAELRCAWCREEGRPDFIRWTQTTTGEPSDGLCLEHYHKLLAEAGLEEEDDERES